MNELDIVFGQNFKIIELFKIYIEEQRNSYIHERLSSANSVSSEEYESFNYIIRKLNIKKDELERKANQTF